MAGNGRAGREVYPCHRGDLTLMGESGGVAGFGGRRSSVRRHSELISFQAQESGRRIHLDLFP